MAWPLLKSMAEKPIRDVTSSRLVCPAGMDHSAIDPAASGPESLRITILPQIPGNEVKNRKKILTF
jgi:hypothetical protein